jgi:hypothetical protein
MMPLIPSPGSPKITSTPQSRMVSIKTSAAVFVIFSPHLLDPAAVEGGATVWCLAEAARPVAEAAHVVAEAARPAAEAAHAVEAAAPAAHSSDESGSYRRAC